MIDVPMLKTLLRYDSDEGKFYWRVNLVRAKQGMLAGCTRPDGYIVIGFHRRSYRAHRLAWAYVTGESVFGELDHINGNPSDNRIENLRLATRAQNLANTRKKISSGNTLKGVTHSRDGRFKAQLRVNGRNTYLGIYATEADAHAAYCAAAEKEFGAYHRAG